MGSGNVSKEQQRFYTAGYFIQNLIGHLFDLVVTRFGP